MLRLRFHAALKPLCTSCLSRSSSSSIKDFHLPVQPALHGEFNQPPLHLPHPFAEDAFLQRYVANAFSEPHQHQLVSTELQQFGSRIVKEIHELHLECERYPPKLQQFDCWGNRIDRIHTCAAWQQMKRISADEGLVAIAYGSSECSNARLLQMLKNFLFAASSGLFSCPIAMTDGAAKVLTGMQRQLQPEQAEALRRLVSRDPDCFWTSGQWMTEKAGGSDVGAATQTVAVPCDDGAFLLHGYKWFSSATDCDMALALGRIVNTDTCSATPGSRGLSLFLVQLRDDSRKLNGIQVVRLKDKLGTRQLATAELLLTGCKAELLGQAGRGVAEISPMLLVTRLHNSVHAAATLRRASHLCRLHAQQRVAFGRRIADMPLHVRSLADLEVNSRAACLFAFRVAQLLGEAEAELQQQQQQLQLARILSPLLKLYTAKQAVRFTQEAMESLGGVGYVEDSGLPGLMRDANVLPIWEGTTNVLCLDLLRAAQHPDAVPALLASVTADCDAAAAAADAGLASAAGEVAEACQQTLQQLLALDAAYRQHAGREAALSLSRIVAAGLLLRFAAETRHEADICAAVRWCRHSDMRQLLRAIRHRHFDQPADQLLAVHDL